MPFRIIREDITKVHADAIVSTANPEPVIGAGTERAVYEAAGKENLLQARKPFGSVQEGSVFVTPGFDLPARYIIHAVYPYYEQEHRQECLDLLRQCCDLALKEAERRKLASIAFPLLGTGSNQYPREDALEILTDSFMRFLMRHEMDITLAVFDHGSYHLSERLFSQVESYLDAQEVDRAIKEEYEPKETSRRRRRKPSQLLYDSMSHGAGAPYLSNHNPYFLHQKEALDIAEEAAVDEDGEESAEVYASAAPCKEEETFEEADVGSMPTLEELVNSRGETFQECLLHWVDRKGLTDVKVYKRANMTRQHFSKIRSNPNYQPKKETVIALAIALELSLEETRDLLEKAGYALSPASRTDAIVQYFIIHKIYDIGKVNISLFDYNEKQLC